MEGLPEPADQGIRLHIDESLFPVEELRVEQHRQPCGIIKSAWFDLALLVKSNLFAQEQNLSCQGRVGASHQRQEAQRITEQVLAHIYKRSRETSGNQGMPWRIPRQISQGK